ncbi:GLPGLI family protein [Haliscomenobacter sp.]|uniref:GLPGLI family protein n=1 Tax=Haliscomenobacter sp. TaxID=2717303 RepID=UPI00359422F5
MRNLLLLFFGVLSLAVSAQNNEGTVLYKQTVYMRREIQANAPAGVDPNMARNIPESVTNEFNLNFTAKVSLYKEIASADDDSQGGPGGGGGMRFMMRRFNPPIYKDLANNRQVEEMDLFGKQFLVDDIIPTRAWKVTGQQKKILDYPCISATVTDSLMGRARVITAWFAPTIPVAFGPQGYGGLPGMILEIDMDGGRSVITAAEVKLQKPDEASIKAPEKGKKVTRAEYQKIQVEKMKEMREAGGGNWQGGGGRQIIIRN